ncbi:antigenic cell wall [Moniliophthora roreri MCA 2997]|uniref:Antigenic cell wall n=2 Tax=Moniliophthora roreri TaxID=221103 RepID=V2WWZ2_MONRO|nr:antigenic cell wall [Moniliophthora roreri MCA 2997]KAI3616516.1 antigenic cell wall [Moniliophthora roreri]
MVQIFSSFVFLLSATAAFAGPVKRDVATVKADIATITTQTTALNNAIQAFPDSGGSLVAALAIHNSAVTLDNTVKKTVTDVQATSPFSDADGADILSAVETLEPIILSALQNIVAKKPAFQALPIGGIPALVLQDLRNLDTDVTALSDALIDKSPSGLLTRANEIKTTIGDAFDDAIAAYS